MSGFIYNIGLNMLGGNSLTSVTSNVNNLHNAINGTNSALSRSQSQLSNVGSVGTSAFNSVTGSVKGMIAQLGGAYAILDSLKTTARIEGLEKAIEFSGGEKGAANLAFVKNNAEKLGLSLEASYEGFKTLTGAMSGTKLESQIQNIFTAVSEGAAVMRLSGEDQKGIFLALGQMVSKGSVQAQELKEQLGERLPKAIQMTAQSMKMTTQELGKQMELGNITADMLLPKLAEELHKTYGPGIAEAVNSSTANFNRFGNAILNLKTAVGENLMPSVISLLNDYLIPGAKWIGEHIDKVSKLAGIVLGIWAWTKLYNTALEINLLLTKGSAFWNGLAAAASFGLKLVTFDLTGAYWELNAAMAANPVGVVLAAIIALGAGIYYAWNHSIKFRGALMGTYESLKVFGGFILDWLISPLSVAGKLLYGIFALDASMIASATNQLADLGEKFLTLGSRSAEAFNKGWNSQVDVSHIGLNTKLKIDYSKRSSVSALDKIPFSEKTKNKGLGDKAKAGIEGITSGGVRNITIQIGKFMDQLIIKSETVEKGTDQMADMIIAKITQAINSANQVQTNN